MLEGGKYQTICISTQLQEELEKVANQIKEEEEKQVVEGKFDI